MRVLVAGKRVTLDPARAIGKGGEADVFDIGGGRALKLFKTPDHPDYALSPAEQQGAAARIAEHQRKLRDFPRGLPAAVVGPLELALDGAGHVAGYVMRLLAGAAPLAAYGEPSCAARGVAPSVVLELLAGLHGTVAALHTQGVVIGDLNDENVLVQGGSPWVIDADSFQFGPYRCGVYTERFVDPLLCDPARPHPVLTQPYTPASDWYAFAALVLQSLLWVGPYGGLYRPRDPARLVAHAARPLHRITVFHPDVRYPRPARPLGVLPDDLLEELRLVFERDRRVPFPRPLLEGLRFTRCTACGTEHARAVCPGCRPAPAAAVVAHVVVRRGVTARRVLATRGTILAAAFQAGRLRALYHEDGHEDGHEGGQFRREDGAVVMRGGLDPALSFRLHGVATLVGKDGAVVTLAPGAAPERVAADVVNGAPAFDCNGVRRFWADGGQLYGDGPFGREVVGSVLAGQTVFWAGPRFGVGFTRAGRLTLGFVFDAVRPGLNDGVTLPAMPGRLRRAACVFGAGSQLRHAARTACGSGADRAYLLLAMERGGRLEHHCLVLGSDGRTRASATAEAGDGSWLGTIGGPCAAGAGLLAPTDAGLVRVEPAGDRLVVTREFPETEGLVHAGCRLVAGDALYVIDAHEIQALSLDGCREEEGHA
ncbi:MAG TPA: hypothetical protein VGQ83_00995 [Polyangia bacterium]|jgi:hypothetical protein